MVPVIETPEKALVPTDGAAVPFRYSVFRLVQK
jgi:hypothetical protein